MLPSSLVSQQEVYHRKPEKVVEDDVMNILWDYNIQTDWILNIANSNCSISEPAVRTLNYFTVVFFFSVINVLVIRLIICNEFFAPWGSPLYRLYRYVPRPDDDRIVFHDAFFQKYHAISQSWQIPS